MSLVELAPNPDLLRQTFSCFPSGVAAIGAVVNDRKEVLIASSFTVGISLEPPLVLFSVQNSSTTWPVLRQAPRLGISILSTEHDQTCKQLASKDKEARFQDVSVDIGERGSLFVHGSPVWLECKVTQEVPAGDHHVVLMEVTSLGFDGSIDPLVFHGSTFRQLMQRG